jgi:ribosome-binding protein aMBF1 (putative translation factor)
MISCDLCGSTKDATTQSITLDGQALSIDLCTKDAKDLDKVAAKYLPHARRITAPRRSAGSGRRTVSDRERSGDIRSWAKTQGFGVSDRGRTPANIEAEYDAAH